MLSLPPCWLSISMQQGAWPSLLLLYFYFLRDAAMLPCCDKFHDKRFKLPCASLSTLLAHCRCFIIGIGMPATISARHYAQFSGTVATRLIAILFSYIFTLFFPSTRRVNTLSLDTYRSLISYDASGHSLRHSNI